MPEYDARNDCYVTKCRLPYHVRGLVKEVVDARLILINEDLSDEAIKRALLHELLHLQRDDLYRDASIEEIEEDDR